MRYRGFTIEPSYMVGYDYVSDDYDYAPDGVIGKCGHGKTIDECKDEIDTYYFENTTYRIERITPDSKTITKFNFLQDAIDFCKTVGEDISNVRPFFKGEEIQFDTV